MCDQTEISYLPGDVVWVKLGPVWWPASVCNKEDVPPEIFKNLRKTPIALVKFFQEDEYEYVQKLENIYRYNCLKKNDFIKKGLDMLRLKNRDAPSNMKLFPEDIVQAEILTGGNRNILNDNIFKPEEKPSYANLFSPSKKTPKKGRKIKLKKNSTGNSTESTTPLRAITHPRFLQVGSDYQARERKQESIRPEYHQVDPSVSATYQCQFCDFATIRLNVIILHNKSHSNQTTSAQSPKKLIKRQSLNARIITPVKTIERTKKKLSSMSSSVVDEPKVKKVKAEEPPVTPITSPRKRGRPRKYVAKPEIKSKDESLTNEEKEDKGNKNKASVGKSDQADPFKESLLEDWAEFDEGEYHEGTKSNTTQDMKRKVPPKKDDNKKRTETNDEKEKESRFDFDDFEDQLVVDKTNMKFGKKIPKVVGRKSMAPKQDDKVEEVEEMEVDVPIEPKPVIKKISELTKADNETKEKELTTVSENVDQLIKDTSKPSSLTKLFNVTLATNKTKVLGKPNPEPVNSPQKLTASPIKKSTVIGVIKKEFLTPSKSQVASSQSKPTLRIISSSISKKPTDVKFTTVPRLEKATPNQQLKEGPTKVQVIKNASPQAIKVITTSPNKTQLVQNILNLVQSGTNKITKVMVKSPGSLKGLQTAQDTGGKLSTTLQKSPGKSIVLTVDTLQSLLKSGSSKLTTVLTPGKASIQNQPIKVTTASAITNKLGGVEDKNVKTTDNKVNTDDSQSNDAESSSYKSQNKI